MFHCIVWQQKQSIIVHVGKFFFTPQLCPVLNSATLCPCRELPAAFCKWRQNPRGGLFTGTEPESKQEEVRPGRRLHPLHAHPRAPDGSVHIQLWLGLPLPRQSPMFDATAWGVCTKPPAFHITHHHYFLVSSQVFERSSMRSRSKKKSKGTRVYWGGQAREGVLFGRFLNFFHHLQLEALCLPSVRGGYPAGTWVRGTVRAGCGKRRMRKPISHRSGRNTGSSWKTRVCTGTWMRRWTDFL